MRTLANAVHTNQKLAEPLPEVFSILDRNNIAPRRGCVVFIVAPPGSGKSYLTQKWIQRLGLPTLYFSADTDPQTTLERGSSIATGHTQADVREGLLSGGDDWYSDILANEFGHVRWNFETDPNYEDLELETTAYAEAFGAFPEVIVIDNLTNVLGDNESEWASMRETSKVIKRLGRITGATIFVLGHVSENKSDATYPAPRKDIQGKVSQLPELILSIAAEPAEQLIRICAVKNRTGPQDPSGNTYFTIYTDLNKGAFYATNHDRTIGRAI